MEWLLSDVDEMPQQHLSEATKIKISKTKKSMGRTGEKAPNYGKHLTPETKVKIGSANSGKHYSKETNMKKGHKGESNPMFGRIGEKCPAFGRTGDKNPMFGKHHSEATRIKIGNAQKGKIGVLCPNYGKHPSEATKIKLSVANKGRPSPMKGKHQSEASREKMREKAPLKEKHNRGGKTSHLVTISLISNQLERLGWAVQSWTTTGERFVRIDKYNYVPDIYAKKGNDIILVEVGDCSTQKLCNLMIKYPIVLQVPKMKMELKPIDIRDLVNWHKFYRWMV